MRPERVGTSVSGSRGSVVGSKAFLLLAEAAPARHHEGDRDDGEHRQPDGHHADDAEGAAERLERAASGRPRRSSVPIVSPPSHDRNRDPLDRRLRKAEQARDERRFLDDRRRLRRWPRRGRRLRFRSAADGRQPRLPGALAGDDLSVEVEVAVADDGGERAARSRPAFRRQARVASCSAAAIASLLRIARTNSREATKTDRPSANPTRKTRIAARNLAMVMGGLVLSGPESPFL